MKKLIQTALVALVLSLMASASSAACYADYKAKQDNPLRLHYGVIKLPDSACSDRNRAAALVAKRIGSASWKLLGIISLFDESGLDQRKTSAGQFFLRF